MDSQKYMSVVKAFSFFFKDWFNYILLNIEKKTLEWSITFIFHDDCCIILSFTVKNHTIIYTIVYLNIETQNREHCVINHQQMLLNLINWYYLFS